MTLEAAAPLVRLHVAQMAPTVADHRWKCLCPMHEGLRPMSHCLLGLHFCGRSLEGRTAKVERSCKLRCYRRSQVIRAVGMQDTISTKGVSSSGALGSTNNLKSGPRPMQSPSRKWRRSAGEGRGDKATQKAAEGGGAQGDIDVADGWYGTNAS